jgi:hypothetical protein
MRVYFELPELSIFWLFGSYQIHWKRAGSALYNRPMSYYAYGRDFLRTTAEVSHAAAASLQPPASKARQNNMPLENGESTNQEVRTIRKKRTANEVSKDPQDD